MTVAAALFAGVFAAKLISVAGIGGLVLGLLQRTWIAAVIAGAICGLVDTLYVGWVLDSQPFVAWAAGLAAGVAGGSVGYLAAWLGGKKNS